MSNLVSFKSNEFWVNNRVFGNILSFAVEVSKTLSTESEAAYRENLKQFQETYWSGKGMELESEFPELEQKKYLAKIFLEVARSILDREVGNHSSSFWQSQHIYTTYRIGKIFCDACQESDKTFSPDTRDNREFNDFYNG